MPKAIDAVGRHVGRQCRGGYFEKYRAAQKPHFPQCAVSVSVDVGLVICLNGIHRISLHFSKPTITLSVV